VNGKKRFGTRLILVELLRKLPPLVGQAASPSSVFFFPPKRKGKISPCPFSKSFSDSVDMNEAVVGQESVFLMNEPAWTEREEFDFQP
jgi:hypothetical protein